MNKQGKNGINWGYDNFYTWSPITGCKRGCTYCYARRIHERFYKNPFDEIIYHHDRLGEPFKIKKPTTIFVGSMSDVEYWSPGEFECILTVSRNCKQHQFMFLSKNPLSYHGFSFPENTMQGLTMECTQTEHCQQENIEQMMKYPHPFLSLEPLLGFLKTHIHPMYKFEKIIVGAMTGPGAICPKQKWIDSIKQFAPESKLFWKPNIRKYL